MHGTVDELSVQKNLNFCALSAISTWKMYTNTVGQKKFDIFSQCMLLSKEMSSEPQGLEKGKREGEATQGQKINEYMHACMHDVLLLRGPVKQRKDKT